MTNDRAAAETEDAFLGGALIIRQPAKGYRAGVDAVLLAAAVAGAEGGRQTLLDAGAGVGTAGLSVARRLGGASVVLVEREAALVQLARENIRDNGLADRARVVHCDLVDVAAEELSAAGVLPDTFDHVVANPPFHAEGYGTPSQSDLKAVSHAMPPATLDHWLRFLARMCRPGGRASVIHKADALAEVLDAFGRRFGGLLVLPIHPRAGEPAIRVLVQGIKGSRAPLRILAPAILHGEGHEFTSGASAVLRLGAALDLDYWKGFSQ